MDGHHFLSSLEALSRVVHQIQPSTKTTAGLRCPNWSSKNVAGLHEAQCVQVAVLLIPQEALPYPSWAWCHSTPAYSSPSLLLEECQPEAKASQTQQGQPLGCPSLHHQGLSRTSASAYPRSFHKDRVHPASLPLPRGDEQEASTPRMKS
jgi:hypothetical protein